MTRHAGRGSRSSRWPGLAPVRRCAILVRLAAVWFAPCCTWCGVELTRETAQIDHVLPRAEGGGHENDNLVGACALCNVDTRRRDGIELDPGLLAAPLDYDAGRRLALQWYAWLPARDRASVEARRVRRGRRRAEHEQAVTDGLGGAAFPFGELEDRP